MKLVSKAKKIMEAQFEEFLNEDCPDDPETATRDGKSVAEFVAQFDERVKKEKNARKRAKMSTNRAFYLVFHPFCFHFYQGDHTTSSYPAVRSSGRSKPQPQP